MQPRGQPIYLLSLIGVLALAACTAVSPPPATPLPPGGTPSPTETPAGFTATLEAAGVIETRPPVPTATPGMISQVVDTSVAAIGLEDVTFLGLASSDWINLAISAVMVLLGYLLGTWVARLIRNRLSPLLAAESAQAQLVRAGADLRWLITLLVLQLASLRLSFISAEIKEIVRVASLLVAVLLVGHLLWLMIDIADAEMRQRLRAQGRERDLDPALILIKRLARVLLVVLVTAAVMSLFGINLTAFAAVLGIGGLAFSLAARSTIEDGIAGAILLADQPFRVGDRIEITAANTWGDVVEIGLRTTRVRTRDNRLVIIPNSVIVSNEIINYTYPDPTYRIETEVGIDYGTDIARVKEVLETAVRSVPDVLDDRPVDILYNEMGDSAMIMRVRWWIQTYADTRRVTDKVHTAIDKALEEAEIGSPFPTQVVLMHSLGEAADESVNER